MVKTKKKTAIKKVKKSSKEKVCEVFEVEKEGKKQAIKTCGTEEVKHATKEQIDKQNKLLRNILFVCGFLLFLFLGGYFFIDFIRHFEYQGVEFDVVQEGELILYKTSIPTIYQGREIPYNFYLRKDPRESGKIELDGELVLLPNMVIDLTTQDLFCDGDWQISIANLIKLYQAIGVKVITDEDAGCDSEGRYLFVTIQSSGESKIEKTGPACYNLKVNNCEILDVTEKLMVENFIKIAEQLN